MEPWSMQHFKSDFFFLEATALWEFSACLVGRRFKILDVAKGETIQKVTFDKIPETSSKICLRVIAKDKPYVTTTEKFIAITLGQHAYGKTLDN